MIQKSNYSYDIEEILSLQPYVDVKLLRYCTQSANL